MTINSVISLLSFADFGLGNGMLNKIGDAFGRNDTSAIRRCVSSGVVLLGSVSCLLIVLILSVYRLLPWSRLFNVHSPVAIREAGPAMAVFVICFSLNLPFDTVQRLQLGLQEGFRNNLWQLVGSIAGLLGVVGAIRAHLGLPWLVAAYSGGPLLSTALNAFTFYVFLRPQFRPSLRAASAEEMRVIGRLGVLFLLLQPAAALAFSSDNLIVAHFLGADAVARYSVAAKLFSLLVLANAMFVGPLWPAYSEARARDDIAWIKSALARSFAWSAAFAGLGGLALCALAPVLLKLWLHRDMSIPSTLFAALAIWTVLAVAGDTFAMFLNGTHAIAIQLKLSVLFVPACLLAKVFLITRWGLPGIPVASSATYVLFVAVPYLWLLPGLLDRCHNTRPAFDPFSDSVEPFSPELNLPLP